MLAAVLEVAGIRTGLIGTLGCFCMGRRLSIRAEDPSINMTTPDPPQLYHILSVMVQEGVQTVVMEASSHALALGKLEPLRFDAAVFTNFTQDHLDFHGSMQAYLDAKLHLLELTKLAVLNVDDPTFAACRITAPCPVVTAGIAQPADYTARDVLLRGSAGVAFTLQERGQASASIRCALPGDFSVSNALLCCACARSLGVAAATVSKALNDFCGVPGRLERVDCGDILPFPVLIDYAHTPDALEKLLRCVRGFMEPQQRLILLFGCGGDRDAGKRPLMAAVAARYADVIYLSADNSRSESTETILDDIARGMPQGFPYRRIADRATAITHAVLHATAEDIVLLAGKGHERYEIDRTGWHPFDEREIVRAAAAQYAGGRADAPFT
jgi:UDP-N-acetylmuramoyl-L-alanyl-D-glutamate--2,6-diaminopimelate ligase